MAVQPASTSSRVEIPVPQPTSTARTGGGIPASIAVKSAAG
jgi:hypothetical protein